MQPTGLDASKYVYNAHQGTEGITDGTTGISLGRKVTTLAEGQSLSKGHAPENSPSTLLPERSVQEPASANETQLTKSPGSRSSVSISQPAQLTADRFFDSGLNVWQGSFFLNPFEFPGFELQPPTRVNEAKAALVACLEKAGFFPSELPDQFGHIDEDLEKQIPLLVENPDSLKTQPRPLDKDILVALGLRVDFPDQGEKVIMEWLNSSDFMDKAARPETATLVKYIIHRCVFDQNKSFFMDICGSLGSRAGSKRLIPMQHEDLYNTFDKYHQNLLSTDDQLSREACRVIGMCLINELGSYLKQIKPPETHEKIDWPNVRWMDKNSEKIEAIDENQLIGISHGGGRYYLKQFLSGQASGYPLKGPGGSTATGFGDTGIQVYPQFNSVGKLNYVEARYDEDAKRRVIEQNSKTSLAYLDLPARLTGKIPAKHVFAAEYVFEGGIKANSVSELVDPKITVFNRSLPPEA